MLRFGGGYGLLFIVWDFLEGLFCFEEVFLVLFSFFFVFPWGFSYLLLPQTPGMPN